MKKTSLKSKAGRVNIPESLLSLGTRAKTQLQLFKKKLYTQFRVIEILLPEGLLRREGLLELVGGRGLLGIVASRLRVAHARDQIHDRVQLLARRLVARHQAAEFAQPLQLEQCCFFGLFIIEVQPEVWVLFNVRREKNIYSCLLC